MVNTKLIILYGVPALLTEASQKIGLIPVDLSNRSPLITNYCLLLANKKPNQISVAGCVAPSHLDHELLVNTIVPMNHHLEVGFFDAGKQCNFVELLHLAEERIKSELSCPLLDEIDLLEFKRIADSVMYHKDQIVLIDESNPFFGKSRRNYPRNQIIPVKCRKPYGKSYGKYAWFNGRFYLRR